MFKALIAFFSDTPRRSDPQPEQRTYRYRYQRFPMDDPQYFTISTSNEAAADELARTEFQALYDRGETVMTTFSRVRSTATNP